jgi:beta-N-acetylhexosaminidase
VGAVWSLRTKVVLALTAMTLAACTGTEPEAAEPEASTTSPATSRQPPSQDQPEPTEEPTQSEPTAPAGESNAVACAESHLADMSLAARAAQLVMAGVPADAGGVPAAAAHAVGELGIGGVILTGRTAVALDDVRTLTDALQRQASSTPSGVRLEVSTDQEGGEVQALSGPGFSDIPAALTQGQMTPAALEDAARGWGRELAAAGVTLDLAPVVDVVPAGAANAPIGAYDREFGHTPGAVAQDGAAFVRGMRAAGVATSIKHFPGLGRASGNTDTTAGVVDDVTTRSDPFLRPFTAAIDAGAPYVMASTATYTRLDPDRLATFSPEILQTLLRDRLGYDGVVISDDLGIAASVADVPVGQRAVRFVAAGGDMVLTVVPEQAPTMVGALVHRAEESNRFAHTLDEALTRVLVRKARAGLASCR